MGNPADDDAIESDYESTDDLRRALIAYDEGQFEACDPADRERFDADKSCLDLMKRVWPVADSAPAEPETPRELGDFRILGEIGRGGMGVVYEAEQLSLGRRVALKVLPYAAMLEEKSVTRFRNEARAAAALDHANIVPVYAVGVERGVHYYAMAYIEGRTLAEIIAALREASAEAATDPVGSRDESSPGEGKRPLSDQETDQLRQVALSTLPDHGSRDYIAAVVKLGIQAALALQHAHEESVVHRDIKPGNLMVEAGGKLWVTDFGLARIESEAGLTATGDLLGTLRYMAPEQADGRALTVDNRADIYGLGATLYELIALRPVCTAQDRGELLRQIDHEDPPSLRQFAPTTPVDLETIIFKAISKDPADRYVTVAGLAEDLKRVLEHRPILARPPSLSNRIAKWSRRHVAGLLALTAFLLSTTIVLAVGAAAIRGSLLNERQARQRADDATEQALDAKRVAEEERAKAEKALDISRDVIRTSSQKLAHDLQDVPRAEHVTNELLSRGLEFYDALLEVYGDKTEVLSDRARHLSEISYYQGAKGNWEAAVANNEEAIRTFRELIDKNPDDVLLKTRLSHSLLHFARRLAERGKRAEAIAITTEQLAVFRQLSIANPESPFYDEVIVYSLECLGRDLTLEGKVERALKTFEEADDLYIEMLQQTTIPAKRVWYPMMRARTLMWRAVAVRLVSGAAKAKPHLELALAIASNACEYDGSSPEFVSSKVMYLLMLADVELDLSNFQRANNLAEEAIQNSQLPALLDEEPELSLEYGIRAKLTQLVAMVRLTQPNKVVALLGEELSKGKERIASIAHHVKSPDGRRFHLPRDLAVLDEVEQTAALCEPIWTAIRDSDDAVALNDIAWILITEANQTPRTARRAVDLANAACKLEQYQNAGNLYALAAAYAHSGDFESALSWYDKASELDNNAEVRDAISRHRAKVLDSLSKRQH